MSIVSIFYALFEVSNLNKSAALFGPEISAHVDNEQLLFVLVDVLLLTPSLSIVPSTQLVHEVVYNTFTPSLWLLQHFLKSSKRERRAEWQTYHGSWMWASF